MKKRYFGFIGLITTIITLTSCNYASIISNKIRSIIISDAVNSYLIGDTFINKCNLSIKARYADGHEVQLNKDDVNFSLSLNSTTYKVDEAFSTQGEYTLTVNKDDVTSNALTIFVFDSEKYVTNIDVAGSHTVEEKKKIDLSLTISPNRYTVPILTEVKNPSIASISKKDDVSYIVEGLTIGETDIVFKAKKDQSAYFETTFHVIVTVSQKVQIKQTFDNYVKKNIYTTSNTPSKGAVKLLVIPIWFTDSDNFISTAKKDNVRSDLTTAFFGTSEQTGWHSVSSYYGVESLDELHISGTVSDWYYPNINSKVASDYSDNEQKTFVEATTNWYFINHTSDSRTNYDYDHDGYLDGVMLIYAAPDYQKYSSFTKNMWAYCYYVAKTSLKNESNPGVNAFFWASYDFIYGDNTVVSRTGGSYANGDTRHCLIDAHTYIHEMGHMFGLDDYYDYSSETSPIAGFSMQDNNVGGHDPFSVMALGWANPYIPKFSGEIVINDFISSHDVILLTPEFNSYNSPFDEYILIELYTPTGLNELDCQYKYGNRFPQGPWATGIRVWHVDARLYTSWGTFINDANSSLPHAIAFNNTYRYEGEKTTQPSNGRSSFAYELGHNIDYQRFNLLHLIRKGTSISYTTSSNLSSNDLFKAGSTFDMSTYRNQFYKADTKLNNGKSLGWSFTVKNIITNFDGSSSATIQIVKE